MQQSKSNITYKVAYKILEAKAIHYLINDHQSSKHASQTNTHQQDLLLWPVIQPP